MAAKAYKVKKRGAGRHVQLPEWLQRTEAWTTMKPGPRALYVELKRRFNGHNNGRIYLSHRDAAIALNLHRNTVGPYFAELEERGFVVMTAGPHLGPSGSGISAQWALTELPMAGASKARTDFKKWKNPAQKPCITVINSVRPRKAG
ncbi:hypothetical protein C1J05_10805 [Sulfitobacter sp. JL08]|nr:hypothetical protein C1J05_10805 [Sulfitobacter sp. JL08]